jgi:hypothetical protein
MQLNMIWYQVEAFEFDPWLVVRNMGSMPYYIVILVIIRASQSIGLTYVLKCVRHWF